MFEILETEFFNVFNKFRDVPNVEIEARFGWKFDNKFSSDIKKHFFQLISQQLESFEQWNNKKNIVVAEINYGDVRKSKIMQEIHPVIVMKKKLYAKDISLIGSPFDLRISVCTEEPFRNYADLKPENITCERSKIRKSYIYKMWSYDLTQVKFDDKYMCGDDEDDIQFQFEIEFIPCSDNETNMYLAKSISAKILDLTNVPEMKST